MSMVRICDRVDALKSQREMTPEGFMRVPATLARCGVYDYSAEACKTMANAERIRKELGLKADEPLKVYRAPDEVFDSESMRSFAGKPVTNNHPPEWISSKNARFFTVGHSLDDIKQDGTYQKATLVITDADTIESIKTGKVEISNGYECDIEKSVGVTDSGEEFHARFVNIRGNHIAIVDKGRAGNECRISDSKPKTETQHMKTIVIDGISHEVSENAAEIVAKLQDDAQKVQDSLTAAQAEHATELAKVQAELDAEKQKVIDAESKVLDSADLDELIEKRTALVADAKSLVTDFDASGKSEAEIVEEVVMKVCDGVDLEGKDDTFKAVYCRARFDAALANSSTATDGSEKIAVTDGEEEAEEDEGEKARKKFIKDSKKSYMKENK